jgi:hypothetical protein
LDGIEIQKSCWPKQYSKVYGTFFGTLMLKLIEQSLSMPLWREIVDVPFGRFENGTVQKSNAQLHRLQALVELAPVGRRNIGASSSSSVVSLAC